MMLLCQTLKLINIPAGRAWPWWRCHCSNRWQEESLNRRKNGSNEREENRISRQRSTRRSIWQSFGCFGDWRANQGAWANWKDCMGSMISGFEACHAIEIVVFYSFFCLREICRLPFIHWIWNAVVCLPPAKLNMNQTNVLTTLRNLNELWLMTIWY